MLDVFGVRPPRCPPPWRPTAASAVTSGVPLVPDGTPILAVLADSHAALFGHGCTEVGEAKATYGTGTSVMAPVVGLSAAKNGYRRLLAWVIDESPTYALEGNILSSGATLAWTADLLTDGRVADLIPSPRRFPTVAASLWFLPSPAWGPTWIATPMQ